MAGGGTAGTGTWSFWVSATADTSTTSATMNNGTDNGVWQRWTTASTSTDASTTIWVQWTGTILSNGYQPKPLTEEELAEQKAQQEERDRQAEERKLKKEAALERSLQLLDSMLSEKQKVQWSEDGGFVVRTKKRRYRIRDAGATNIDEINRRGKIIERWCIHPNGVPKGDKYLAQKLMLEANEKAFRETAIRHGVPA